VPAVIVASSDERHTQTILAQPDGPAMIRLWKAFFYSMAGLREAWDEPACRLEIYLLAIATPLALWLPVPHLEQLLLVGSVAAIFVVELLNTSVEAAIDRIGPERHELSRIAKDLGSAAVFAAAVYAAAVWAVLAGPALLALVPR
jgi:diacylglycerol kinase (ATP)